MRLAKFNGQLVDYAAAELMLTQRDLSQRLTCPACAQHVDIVSPSKFLPAGGSAWLFETVPDDVLEWLRSLPDADKTPAWI